MPRKVLEYQKKEILKRLMEGESYQDIAKDFNVSSGTIYFIGNPEKKPSPSKLSMSVAKSIQKARIKVINLLGGKCKVCGFKDIRALQIDHKNGKGGKELRLGGSYKMYLKIINDYDKERKNYQVLCANCNWIKRYENNEVRNGIYHNK